MASKFQVILDAKFDKAQIQKEVDKLSGDINISVKVNSNNASLKQTNQGITDLGKAAESSGVAVSNLENNMKKFLQWQIIGDIISSAARAISSTIDDVFELNSALVELNKVTNMSEGQLEKFSEQAYEVGSAVARTGIEVINASTEFSKAGYDKQALALAEVASMYQNVADGEISAADASALLISTMKAFNIQASQSESIIDKINEVSNKYAVSSSDLGTALPKVSATMAQAGNTLDETIGLITAGSEIMIGQSSRVARGLRSISLNLQGMDDSGNSVLGLTASLEQEFNKIGITLMGSNGQMKSTFDILKELSERYKTLKQDKKNYYSELIGGKTQVDVVNSVLSNFDSALGANQASLNSAGSAAKENAVYMQSLEAKVNGLNSAWEKLTTNLISSNVVGILLDITKAFVSLADTGIGRAVITLGSLALAVVAFKKSLTAIKNTSVVNSALKGMQGLLNTLKKSYISATVGLTGFKAVAVGTTASIKVLTAALLSNPLFWGAAALGAVAGITKLIDKLNVSFEESTEKVRNSYQAYSDASSKVETMTSSLEKLRSELEKISPSNTNAINAKEKEITLLERELAIQEAIAEEKRKEAAEEAQKARGKKQEGLGFMATDVEKLRASYKVWAPGASSEGLYGTEHFTPEEEIEANIKLLDKLEKSYSKMKDKTSKAAIKNIEGQREVIDRNKELAATLNETLEVLAAGGEEYEREYDSLSRIVSEVFGLNEAKEDSKEVLTEEQAEIQRVNELLLENGKILGENIVGEDSLINTNEEFSNSLKAIKQDLDLVNSALQEQSENGGLSIDTIANLISSNEDYINFLYVENGAVRLNSDAYEALGMIKIKTALSTLEQQKIAAEAAVANASNSTNALVAEKDMTLKAALAYNIYGQAKASASKDGGTSLVDAQAELDRVNKQINIYNALMDSLKTGGGKTSSYSYTPKTTSRSGGSAREKYRPEVDALYGYKTALENAKNQVDRLNDALDNTESFDKRVSIINQLIKSTQNQIGKTEALKRAQTNQINNYIYQLKRYGFSINYNSKTNELMINNMSRLGAYTGDTAKSLEKLIKNVESLNKDNIGLDSSVSSLTGKISDFNKELRDIPTEKLNKFKELLGAFQESQLQDVSDQIKDIQHAMETDETLKALNQQLELLEEQTDEKEKQKNLEEKLLNIERARIALANAQKQKNVQVYTEKEGWSWVADPKAISTAQKDLEDAEREYQDYSTDLEIDKIQEQIDIIEKGYEDKIDLLQNFLDNQEYIIDKAGRKSVQTFGELKDALSEYGLNSQEYLSQAAEWLYKYNNSLKEVKNNMNALTVSAGFNNNLKGLTAEGGASGLVGVSSNILAGLTMPKINNGSSGGSTVINIDNISLPNVQDSQGFIEALKQLPGMAIASSTSRI